MNPSQLEVVSVEEIEKLFNAVKQQLKEKGILVFVDKLKGFKFFKLRRKFFGILAFVEVHQIFFVRELRFLDAAGNAVV